MTRVLGIDHGTRRIGVAVGDRETGLAFARAALSRRREDAALDAIGELTRGEGIETVVIGLPLNMDGSEGRQAALARAFGDRLERIGLSVVYLDERLTSWEAGERLAEAGRRASRRSGELDSAAARIILQQYLDMTKEDR